MVKGGAKDITLDTNEKENIILPNQAEGIVRTLTMTVIELESPEQFGVIILPKTADVKRKDGYSVICNFQTNDLYIIQEIAGALERQKIKCDITSFTNPENGSNIYTLWGKARFTFSIRFVKKHHGLSW